MPLAAIPNLVIGSVTVPNRSGLELSCAFEDLEGAGIVRLSDGSTRKITTWGGKLRLTVSGDGAIPTVLQPGVLNYAQSHTVKSPVPRAIWSASNVITVPAARRTDLSAHVIGIAITGSFDAVETPVSMGGHVATLTAVSGATGYQALYWPQFTAWLTAHAQTQNRRTARDRWSVTATEA